MQKSDRFLLLSHGKVPAVFHVLAVFLSYSVLVIFFQDLAEISRFQDNFFNSYIVFLIFSASLSTALLFTRTSYTAGILLLFRCYLIMIAGYGAEGYFSVKLILGFALLLECGTILTSPWNRIFTLLSILFILISQNYLPLFGHPAGGYESYAPSGTMAVMGFLLSAFGALVLIMVGQADSRAEMYRDLKMQKETMKTLARFNADLQNYARKIDVESSDRERNRISREIHDISGYIFTNLIALLNAASSIPPEKHSELSDILITAGKQAREGLNETRTALRKTREVPIPEEEGVRAINKIISIFQKVTGVSVRVNWGNTPHSFSREMNFALYRTIQEALTNAIRHGKATEITIHFQIEGAILHLTIIDNGQGAGKVVKGIGLAGMEERIGNLGGTIRVEKAPGGGFQLIAEVPLKRPDDKKNDFVVQ